MFESILVLLFGVAIGFIAAVGVARLGSTRLAPPASEPPMPEARSARLARMVAILNALPDTLVVIDDDDGVVELKLSQRAGRSSAVPRLEGVRLDDLFSPEVSEALRAARRECVDSAHVSRRELELELAGERRLCEVRMVRADPRHVALLIRDVTEQAVTARILTDAKETAEAMVTARTEFMGHMSHDIRNAMTGVLTMTDVLLHRAADPATKRYLEVIQRSGEHLVGLVGDIVDFSRLEQGRMSFEPERIDVRRLITDTMEFHARSADGTGLDIVTEIAREVPDTLLLDAVRFRQLVDNLVGNAIKFTERGGVHVRLGYENGSLELVVRDTGVGMSEQALATIFDAFVQAPNRPSGKPRGSGLGLSIARQLATSMGGTIEAKSREGHGTTLRVVVRCV